MIGFIKYLLNEYNDHKTSKTSYDEDGNFIHPDFAGLSDEELVVPAEKARILHSKASEDVKLKNRKKVFYLIHKAIKKGKTQIKLDAYVVKPETLAYFESLGYGVRDVIPDPPTGNRFTALFDEDGEEQTTPGPYHYYIVSWAPEVEVEQNVVV